MHPHLFSRDRAYKIPTMSVLCMPYIVLKFRILCYPFTGGFYSDNLGHVAENCKTCPTGSFVAYDKAPGTRAQDCKSCPHGKQLFLVVSAISFINDNLFSEYPHSF